MSSRLRIVVTGLIGQHPLGGVTWDYLQYVLGLVRLGHDVFYFEDSGEWPYSSAPGASGHYEATDCSENVGYLTGVMRRFDLADRWAFRCPIKSQWFGLSDRRRAEVLSSTDLLLNVSGTLVRPLEYGQIGRLAYVDSDPVFTQVKLARGVGRFGTRVDAHDVHFSFGEALSDKVPSTGHAWQPTRQPIVLSEWRQSAPRRDVYTTVMNWTSYNSVSYGGTSYRQKNFEFKRFVDLPRIVAPTQLELAIKAAGRKLTPGALIRRLQRKGWRVVDPAEVCPDLESYRRYIETSKGEWSVAKGGYVAGQPGWFSCRSACYLAAGRPVIVQDTGFAAVLPVGEGIVPFSTVEEAAAGIRDVEAHYDRHAAAAREIAEAYFDSDTVLSSLVERAMSSPAVAAAGGTRP